MNTIQKILALATTAILFTACGSQEESELASKKSKKKAALGNTVVSCSVSINGKTVTGNTQAECDKLKAGGKIVIPTITVPVPPAKAPASPAPAAGGNTQVACAFNINGKLYEGKSQAECDKLKLDLAGSLKTPAPAIVLPPAPVVPAPPATIPAPSGGTQYACAYNINGVLREGKSQAECDKLKKDLGINFP